MIGIRTINVTDYSKHFWFVVWKKYGVIGLAASVSYSARWLWVQGKSPNSKFHLQTGDKADTLSVLKKMRMRPFLCFERDGDNETYGSVIWKEALFAVKANWSKLKSFCATSTAVWNVNSKHEIILQRPGKHQAIRSGALWDAPFL